MQRQSIHFGRAAVCSIACSCVNSRSPFANHYFRLGYSMVARKQGTGSDRHPQTNASGRFAAANKATFKPRSDIEGLGRKLRAIMRKVDVADVKPNERQRLADELLRLSSEAHWFADQVSKVK
jgi:hypothetical protein